MQSRFETLYQLQSTLPYAVLSSSTLMAVAESYVTALSDCLHPDDAVLYYPFMRPQYYHQTDPTWSVSPSLWTWLVAYHRQYTWPTRSQLPDPIRPQCVPMTDCVPLKTPERLLGVLFWSDITPPLSTDEADSIWQTSQVIAYIMSQLAIKQTLTQTNRMALLGKMAASLAHEIKNPLVAIQTFIQLIPEHWDQPSFRDEFSTTVAEQVQRISDLATSLSQLGRINQLVIAPMNLNASILKTLDIMRGTLSKEGISVVNKIDASITLRADQRAFEQVFMNIMINAVQAKKPHTPYTPQITLSATPLSSAYIQLSCEDNGIGMSEAVQNQITDPFFTTKDSGSGVGMMVVRQFLHMHYGQMHIHSIPDKGTVVTLYLPTPEANPNQFESETGLFVLRPDGMDIW